MKKVFINARWNYNDVISVYASMAARNARKKAAPECLNADSRVSTRITMV